MASLVHELRVHQIELEMQNEELHRAQVAAEEQTLKYYELFDAAPVGYVSIDDQGLVTEANLTATKLLGVERRLLIGQPFSAFVDSEDRDVIYLQTKAMEKTGEAQAFDLRLYRGYHRPGGVPSRFWAHLEAQLQPHGVGEKLIRLTFSDITDRKRTETALVARLLIAEYAQDHSLDETIQKALDQIEAATDSTVAFFHFVDEDQKSLRLQTWSTNTLATQCTAEGEGSHYDLDKAGVWADCLRQGRPIIHNDYASLPDKHGMPEGHAELTRELTVPILRGGKVRVVLGVGNKVSDYDSHDLEMVVALADQVLDIVLAKRAEEEVRQNQAKLQTLFELLPVGVAALDAQGTPLYANPALQEILDISDTELRRGDHRKRTYIRVDGTTMPVEEFASSIASREQRAVRGVEVGVVLPDGSTIWTSVNAAPVESGDWRSIIVTSDITERMRAQRELIRSEARYERLFANMLEGYAYCKMIFDEEGRPIDWVYLDTNPAFSRLTGLVDVQGKSVLEVLPEVKEQSPELFDLYGRVTQTGGPEEFEIDFKPLGMWLRVSVTRPEPGHFAAVFQDVTKRKLSEGDLRLSESNLNKAQHFARLGSWTWNIKTGLLEWSDEMFRLFGIDKETFSGSLGDVVTTAIHPDDREKVEASNLSVMNDSKPIPLEYRVIWPDQSVHTVYAEAGEMVTDDEGNPALLMGTVQDITERKRIEAFALMEKEILQVLNAPGDSEGSIRRVLTVLKTWTGFDAVGLRLQDGDDYPYIAATGFPDDFLITENTLLERDADGNILLDEDGNVELECTCGLVIHGETDPGNSILTPGGSFWTNDSFPLLDLAPDEDPRLRPRNQCMSYGYASMALVPIRSMGHTVGLLHLNDKAKGRLNLELVERLEGIASHIGEALLREQSGAALRKSEASLRTARDRLAASFLSSIDVLSQVVEARDPYTAGHERRVSQLAVRIAQELDMPAEQIDEIRIAALIHDVGKISVPAEILSKPGKLSPIEFSLIKNHSEAGYQILTSAKMPEVLAETVYQHHERCDGSGYPRGLSSEDLLQGAKIIMVADVVEAMSSHRPYRASLGIEPALAEIALGAGERYDSAVAEACAAVFSAGFAFTDSVFSNMGARSGPPAADSDEVGA